MRLLSIVLSSETCGTEGLSRLLSPVDVDSERVNGSPFARYDTLADDCDENKMVDAGGERGGKDMDAGSTFAELLIRLVGRSLGECVERLGEAVGLIWSLTDWKM